MGKAALESVGGRRWSKRVHKIIAILETVFAYELLYIGGGNAKWIEPPIRPHVKIVPNIAGITGGVRLWDRRMDHAFTEQPFCRSAGLGSMPQLSLALERIEDPDRVTERDAEPFLARV